MVPTPAELESVRPMTWDEVRALNESGIEIGSHTVSHPFLVQLTDQELHRELADSKQRIEEETGTTVSSLSYPTGGSEYFDSRSVQLAKDLGYAFAVSYDHRVASITAMNKYAIPRVHVEPEVHLPLFKANMLAPGLFVR
jgi:peptidoglycan/xylan/chitin deacetylase (PgdA/CDA1 family)